MGSGYSFKCIKCGYKYSVMPGIGKMYPSVYRDTLAEVAAGTYGDEWKKIMESIPYAAVDASRKVYICSSCGNWEEAKDITLYAPNDPKTISKKQYGEKTVEEIGYVPYVVRADLKKDYHVIKRYYCKCKNCGKRMRKASLQEEQTLPCPKCGTVNVPNNGLILWD